MRAVGWRKRWRFGEGMLVTATCIMKGRPSPACSWGGYRTASMQFGRLGCGELSLYWMRMLEASASSVGLLIAGMVSKLGVAAILVQVWMQRS